MRKVLPVGSLVWSRSLDRQQESLVRNTALRLSPSGRLYEIVSFRTALIGSRDTYEIQRIGNLAIMQYEYKHTSQQVA